MWSSTNTPLVFFVSLLLPAALLAAASSARQQYDGFQLVRAELIDGGNDNEVAGRLQRFLDGEGYDVWSSTRSSVTFVARREDDALARFELENALSLELDVVLPDLGEIIEAERSRLEVKLEERSLRRLQDESLRHTVDWEDYHTLEELYEYFDYLADEYDFVEQEALGLSYEGRELRLLKVCTDGCNEEKPAMYIQANIHAREWVSPAVLTYLVNQLVEERAGPDFMLQELDWYFVPSVNPDGYVYTWEEDRLWRKTRSVDPATLCMGVDGNRNFDYEWEKGGTPGVCCVTMGQPCAQDYKVSGCTSSKTTYL